MTLHDAKKILEANIYCDLSTVCEDGSPWGTPVFFGFDNDLNIYWRSSIENQHSRNILHSPKVFITVYDSHAPWGEGVGLYLTGEASVISDNEDVRRALEIIDRRSPKNAQADEFSGDKPRRIYKFTPKKIWNNVDSEKNGFFVDSREAVR